MQSRARQLMLGTLLLLVDMFLLPTTLLYYAYFTAVWASSRLLHPCSTALPCCCCAAGHATPAVLCLGRR